MTDRNAPFDLARVLACCAVIVLHAAAGYLYQYGTIPLYQWHFANAVDSAVRWCVPVFVLLSGALNVSSNNTQASAFIGRRFRRLSLIIVFWSAVFLAYSGVQSTDDIAMRFLAGQPYYHLYFLFLIGGLYLFTPAFAAYGKAVGDRQLLVTGVVCLAVACAAWTITDRRMTAFSWFLPFIGYYLVGGPISRKPLPLRIALVGAVLSLIATIVGTWLLVDLYGPNGTGLYLYNYLSPTVIVMSVCVYSIFLRTPLKKTSILTRLSSITLGVYVLHPMILETLQMWIPQVLPPIGAVKSIALLSAVTILLSFLVAWLGSRLPYMKAVFK